MHFSWENKLVNLPSFWGTIWTKPHSIFRTPAHLVSLLHWWRSSLLSHMLHWLESQLHRFWPWRRSGLGPSLKGLCKPRGLFSIGSESRASGAGRAWGMCELRVLLPACAHHAVGSSARLFWELHVLHFGNLGCALGPVARNAPSESFSGHRRQGLLQGELAGGK